MTYRVTTKSVDALNFLSDAEKDTASILSKCPVSLLKYLNSTGKGLFSMTILSRDSMELAKVA